MGVRLVRWRIQFNPGSAAWLLDYLIRSRQHIRRNCQTDLLCRLEIDHKPNFFGCSTGRSAGLAPFRMLSTKYATRR
jgi:hypothetical protein